MKNRIKNRLVEIINSSTTDVEKATEIIKLAGPKKDVLKSRNPNAHKHDYDNLMKVFEVIQDLHPNEAMMAPNLCARLALKLAAVAGHFWNIEARRDYI